MSKYLTAYLELEKLTSDLESKKLSKVANVIRDQMDYIWKFLNEEEILSLRNRTGIYPEYVGKI